MKKALLVSLFLVASITIVMGLRHPDFQIQHIQITGTHYTPASDIEAAAKNLLEKHILCTLFLGDFKAQLLAQHASIQSIQVKAVAKNKVQIRIKEKPEWLLCLTGHHTYVLARDGSVLNRLNPGAPIQNLETLLIIHGLNESQFQNSPIPAPALQLLQHIHQALQAAFPNKPIQVDIQHSAFLTLILEDQLPVKLGRIENLPEKLHTLSHFCTIYPAGQRQDWISIALSSPKHIAIATEDK